MLDNFRVAFAHFAIVFVHFALAHLAVLQLYLRILHCCNCICALFFDLDYSHSHCRGSDSHCSTTQIILLHSNSHRWGPLWAFIGSLCHSMTCHTCELFKCGLLYLYLLLPLPFCLCLFHCLYLCLQNNYHYRRGKNCALIGSLRPWHNWRV